MPLNFWKEDADDGTNTDESIQPIENGDPVEEAYLNRSAGNIRSRTEQVREHYDFLERIEMSDRNICFVTNPDAKVLLTQSGGAGEYQMYLNSAGTAGGGYDRDLYIVPMLTPSRPGETLAHNVPARFYYEESSGNGVYLEMDTYSGAPRRVVHGAHNIYWRIEKDASVTGTPVVEILADNPGTPDPQQGPVVIIVKIKSDDTTTLTEIDNAIDASAAGSLVTASVNGTGSTAVALGGADYWGPYRAYETDAGDVGVGAQAGVDEEGFRIPYTALNTFFVTNGRRLKDGDTLFLDFDSAKTREETTTVTVLDETNLHIISADERAGTDSRNLGDAMGPIPICKFVTYGGGASDVALMFANGRFFNLDQSDYLMSTGAAAVEDLETRLADATDPNGDNMIGSDYKSAVAGATFALPAGTVDSQFQSVIDQLADATGSPSGDEKIGAPSKVAASGIAWGLGTGTVKSQIQEILDEIADTSVSTPGAANVGAKVQASGTTDFTVSQGSVSSQILELLNNMDSHAAGSAGVHALSVIDGVPFVTVGAGGDYDYTEISSAFLDLITTGGVILVTPGTYTGTLTTSATLSKNIAVVGMGGVTWSSGSADIMNFTGTINARITFQNIIFYQTSGTYRCLDGTGFNGASDVRQGLYFENCMFSSSGTGTDKVNVNNYNSSFYQCFFLSNGHSNNSSFINVTSNAMWTSVRECEFRDIAIIGDIDSTYVWFEGNRIKDCGYSSTQTAVGRVLTIACDWGSVCKNAMWGHGGGSTNFARFVEFDSYSGSVSDNEYECTNDISSLTGTQASTYYVINALAFDDYQSLVVRGNSLSCAEFGGIYSDQGVHIDGNSLRDMTTSYATQDGIYANGENPRVTNNNVSSDGSIRRSIYTNQEAHIANNHVTGNKAGEYAIYSAGWDSTVTANRIYDTYGCNGIFINSFSIAADNYVEIDSGGDVGISATGNDLVVTGNLISGPDNYGIYMNYSDEGVVSGNWIRNCFGGTPGTAIHCTSGGYNLTFSGNTITGSTNGIDLGGNDNCVVTGNFIGVAGSGFGIDASNSKQTAISGNTIRMTDVAGGTGIDASFGSLTSTYTAITGNVIVRDGTSNAGAAGIDLTYNDDMACSGNSIWPYSAFTDPIDTTSASGVGLGKNNSTDNTDTYNSFGEAV